MIILLLHYDLYNTVKLYPLHRRMSVCCRVALSSAPRTFRVRMEKSVNNIMRYYITVRRYVFILDGRLKPSTAVYLTEVI